MLSPYIECISCVCLLAICGHRVSYRFSYLLFHSSSVGYSEMESADE